MVFRWRKRNDGFEWRTYVRTTILVRRHERRQRAEDVKAAAVFGVKQAGMKGSEAAGTALKAAQRGSLSALRWSGRKLAAGARSSAADLASAAQHGARGARAGWVKGRAAIAPKMAAAGAAAKLGAMRAAQKLEPAAAPLRQPGLQLALKLVAAVAFAGSLIRAKQFGWDNHSLFALAAATIAFVLLLASGLARNWHPVLRAHKVYDGLVNRLSALPGFGRMPQKFVVLTAAGVVILAGAVVWNWQRGSPHSWRGFPGLPGLSSSLSQGSTPSGAISNSQSSKNQATGQNLGNDATAIDGYASVLSGDTMRLSGVTIRLEGIEAPHRLQTCLKPTGKRWDCAASARDALSRLVKRQRVTCRVSGSDSSGVRLAKCQTADGDLAADLVRKGHVFAQSGLFAAYSAHESEAQAAKSGLWSGDTLRPADWRSARWEEAKRKAPDGCPIKGQVSQKSGKVYMLPWSPDYDRARINAAQGERWFCSESEAVSAGWKPF